MGVVNTKRNICGDPVDFFAIFDSLIVLTTRSDVYISKSGDFRADNNDNDKRLLYPLRMRAG